MSEPSSDREVRGAPEASPSAEADLGLVRAVLRRDAEAIRTFVDRMRVVARILASRNRRLGGPLDAGELADLTQDTLLRVWKKLETYEGRGSLETWVYRFCFLELMNAVRHKSYRSHEKPETPLEALLEEPNPEEPADDSFESLLRLLSPGEAQVVRLRHVEELAFGEIGELLGSSPSSIKTRYYRGLEKIKSHLESHGQAAAEEASR